MRITLSGTDDIHEAFSQLVPKIQAKTISRLAQTVYADVRKGADRHTKTGSLYASINLRRQNDSTYWVFHQLQKAPYAPFVHWGSKPHVIRPRKRKALRWASGGAFRFAKFVNHPGYQGDPYMVTALNAAPQHFAAIVKAIQSEV